MSAVDVPEVPDTYAPTGTGVAERGLAGPAVLPGRRGALLADLEHAAAIYVALLLVVTWSRHGADALLTVFVLAGVWVVALRSAYRAARLSVFALGVPICALIGTGVGLAAVSILGFWLPWAHLAPTELVLAALAVFVSSAVFERFVAPRRLRPRRVLFLGGSGGVHDLLGHLAKQPRQPFEPIGVVGAPESAGDLGLPWVGDAADLATIVARERPDLVVVADDGYRGVAVGTVLDVASRDVRVVGVHDFCEHALGRVPVQHLSPVWFMSVVHLYQRSHSRFVKRAFDVVLAGAGLTLAAPVILVVAALVRLSGPGPVLYRQTRSGEGGKEFQMLKFRTMVADAERADAPVWATVHDPRVTRVGRTLRKLRLDELPQLWNVVRGDMSVIGPRPERPEFLGALEASVPYWSRRHLMKPGITGWAQVMHGYTADELAAADKLSYDLYYLKHRSFVLDLAIALKTVGIVVTGFGAR